MTVSGTDSFLEVTSGGRADAGATAQIGRGGTGTLNVNGGATFRVVDNIGTDYDWDSGDGLEVINVGRDSGSNGTLTVDSGHVVISGTGSRLHVGRDSGTGTANFTNGSTLELSSTLAAGDVSINIGRAGTGSMLLSASTATLTAGGAAAVNGEDYGASVNIGRDVGAVGTLALQSGSSLVLNGDSNLPGTPGSYASIHVGRDGGNGTMTLGGSTVALNGGPEGAWLFVGRNIANTATPTTGTLGLTASTITIDSARLQQFSALGAARGSPAPLRSMLPRRSRCKVI